ncbi:MULTISPECIES: signal peptidase II [unclassified Pseudofrankia]|uniref:signal peptidase II n=1 Tax=unclassified Pseudofrankia TaxID=2994372 RepID=UPI001F51BD89|nr:MULTISPECIES: signal peptidase II [unclassified Pseudofrankia]MDT3441072.1 signal peptidase II [Pseudofrankia sp. BMG5.37]
MGEAPTSEGDVPGPGARGDDEETSIARAYLDWGKGPDLAAGKATGAHAGQSAQPRADGAPGGVTRPGDDGQDGGGGGSAPHTTPPRRSDGRVVGVRRPIMVLLATSLGVVLLDAITKIIVVAKLTGHDSVTLVPGVLELRLTRNSGAAFSIAGGATALFSLIAVAVIVVVAFTARKLGSRGWAVVLGAIVGGAVGNLIDRLVRSPGPLRGHVVDWIYLHHWPIFNIADSSIVVGAVLAVVLSALGIGLDGTRLARQDPAGPAEAAKPAETGDASGTPETDRPSEPAGRE